jgi:hypothetical protein
MMPAEALCFSMKLSGPCTGAVTQSESVQFRNMHCALPKAGMRLRGEVNGRD